MPQGSRSRTCCTVSRRLAHLLTYGLDSDKWDWEAIAESEDYFSDTESGNEGRGRMREILESAELGYHADEDSADEWDVGVYNESFRNRIKDERWWCVRGGGAV